MARLVITLTNLNVLITEVDNATSRPQPDLLAMQDVNAARDQQIVYEGTINNVRPIYTVSGKKRCHLIFCHSFAES